MFLNVWSNYFDQTLWFVVFRVMDLIWVLHLLKWCLCMGFRPEKWIGYKLLICEIWMRIITLPYFATRINCIPKVMKSNFLYDIEDYSHTPKVPILCQIMGHIFRKLLITNGIMLHPILWIENKYISSLLTFIDNIWDWWICFMWLHYVF